MGYLAGWNTDRRIEFTIDHTMIDENLYNFTVFIPITETSETPDGCFCREVFEHFDPTVSGVQADRKKIAVTDESDIQLMVEVERWTDEFISLWVKVNYISSNVDTKLYFYYDKDHADNTEFIGDSGSSLATGLWDEHFDGVWHLTQDIADGACILDSSSNRIHGTTASYLEYNKSYSKEDIIVTASDALNLYTSGDAQRLVDGTSGGVVLQAGSGSIGEYFDFDFGALVNIAGGTLFQSGVASHGTWQWSASVSGTSYTNIGSGFTLAATNPQDQVELASNTEYYKHYRLEHTGGSANDGVTIYEIDFDGATNLHPTTQKESTASIVAPASCMWFSWYDQENYIEIPYYMTSPQRFTIQVGMVLISTSYSAGPNVGNVYSTSSDNAYGVGFSGDYYAGYVSSNVNFKLIESWNTPPETIAVDAVPVREYVVCTATFDGSSLKLYRNGTLVDSKSLTGWVSTDEAFWFGVSRSTKGTWVPGYRTQGGMRAIQISSVVRDEYWLKAAALSSAGKLVTKTGTNLPYQFVTPVIRRNIWTTDDYVFKATDHGAEVYEYDINNANHIGTCYSSVVNSVWADNDYLYMATTDSGVLRSPITSISGLVFDNISTYKSYPDIQDNYVTYIHGNTNNLCISTVSGVDNINLTTNSGVYLTTPLQWGADKCYQTNEGSFYYVKHEDVLLVDEDYPYLMVFTISGTISSAQEIVQGILTPSTFNYNHALSDGSDLKFYDIRDQEIFSTIRWYKDSTTTFDVQGLSEGDTQFILKYGNLSTLVGTQYIPTTYDPVRVGVSSSLSNDNLTHLKSGGNPWSNAKSETNQSSGKYYCEWRDIITSSNTMELGISNNTFDLDYYLGGSSISYGYMSQNGKIYYNTGGGLVQSTYGPAWTDGDIIGMAVDFDSNTLWFSKNGVWQGNPVAGTGAIGIVGGTAYRITGGLYGGAGNNVQQTLVTSTNDFSYTPPSGFDTWPSLVLLGGIDSAAPYEMWYQGYYNSPSVYQIGRATSYEGIYWQKHGVELTKDTSSSSNFDYVHVGYPFVMNDGGQYKMWYNGYSNSSVWTIGYVEDSWAYQDIALDTVSTANTYEVMGVGPTDSWDDYYLLTPNVIKDDYTYKMWYGGHDGTNYRIGYATSYDGVYWKKYSGNPVLDVGAGGEFDQSHVLRSCVIKDGSTYKMWYAAHNGTYWADIGYATSTDGIVWAKQGSVLTIGSGGEWDDYGAYAPNVIKDGSTYRMWYAGKTSITNWRVGYATSTDGISWTKQGMVLDFGGAGDPDDTHVTMPSVVKNGSTYEMRYAGHDGANWTICYATSTDGISWTKQGQILGLGTGGYFDDTHTYAPTALHDNGVIKMWHAGHDGSTWNGFGYTESTDGFSWDRYLFFDKYHIHDPNVIRDDTNYKMWYRSNAIDSISRIGIATSSDGASWTKMGMIFDVGAPGSWEDNNVVQPWVLKEGSTYKMWYAGKDSTNYRIGYATSSNGITWSRYGAVIDIGTGGDFDDEHVLAPCVIKDGSIYKMWYAGRDGADYRIGYATSPDETTWTKQGMVLDLGSGGDFDSRYAYKPCVIKESDTSYIMYYSGYDNTYWKAMYATSTDGITWVKQGVDIWPGFSANDATHTNNAFVMEDDSVYKMWYCGYPGSPAKWRVLYAKRIAAGEGYSWTKNRQQVLDVGTGGDFDDAHTYIPSVIKDGSTYKMWYAGSDGNWRIGYATSSDGVSWTKQGMVLDLGTGGSWDDTHVSSPSVIKESSTYKLWYTGNDGSYNKVGYATSSDGINWTKYGMVLDLLTPGEFDEDNIGHLSVIKDSLDGYYKLYYAGNRSPYWEGVGQAISSDGINWTRVGQVLSRGESPEWDSWHLYAPYVLQTEHYKQGEAGSSEDNVNRVNYSSSLHAVYDSSNNWDSNSGYTYESGRIIPADTVINDIYVAENKSQYNSNDNVILLATDTGSVIIEERKGDEANSRYKYYRII